MRESGILLHISSLPGPYGIGTMGKAAFKFVDFLAAAGQKYWQILPIGPTSVGDSPYQSCSVYAGNPYFVDLEALLEQGLLEPEDMEDANFGQNPAKADYAALYYARYPVLERAYDRGRTRCAEPFAAFCKENPWVEDYALFMALKRKFGMLPWSQWPEKAAMRDPKALTQYRRELKDDVGFFSFIQYLFYTQWEALHNYARAKGVKIIGDMPIYVPIDSVEVWQSPNLFQVDSRNEPTAVAGCPPDAFTADGQLWGNPLYDWDAMKKENFAWWRARVAAAANFFDVIRIDHFRGLESYWAVPAGDETARGGSWKPGPGMALLNALRETCPNTEFIAEDLGYMTPEVRQLQEDSGYPGMKVLEFAFDGDSSNHYLPHNHVVNSVCYTGTHDNETLLQWFENAPQESRDFAIAYLGLNEKEGLMRGILRGGMASVARIFVAQMQDWLELGAEARMNTPGLLSDCNWSWRLTELPSAALAKEIREMTDRYDRLH